MISPQNVANDNEMIPARKRARRIGARPKTVSVNRNTVRTRPYTYSSPQFDTVKSTPISTSTPPRLIEKPVANIVALICWIASFAFMFFALRDLTNPALQIVSSVIFGWASLFLFSLSRIQLRNFYKTLGLTGVLLSFVTIAYILHTGFNIIISAGALVCLASIISLSISALLGEKLPLLISISLSAIWIVVAPADQALAQLIWIFPSLFVLQFYLSRKMQAPLLLALTIVTVLFWVTGYISDFITHV